jgi:TM2 domain-containing membrane protein YozV
MASLFPFSALSEARPERISKSFNATNELQKSLKIQIRLIRLKSGERNMRCANHPQAEASGACVYCGKFFCSDCLVDYRGRSYCKAHIGNALDAASASPAGYPPPITIHNTVNAAAVARSGYVLRCSTKSKTAAFLLCLFFGLFGVHRFYVGKFGTGLLWAFTGGLFVFGWIVDLVAIASGTFADSYGFQLKRG